MSSKKIIKLPNGNAFIEIGENSIRIGVGAKVFLTLDENTLTAGGDQFNYQMDPKKIVYQGIISQAGAVQGLFPVGPKYNLNLQFLSALINTARCLAELKSASIGS
jgi:hypothetical protein